jgi:hypothetical protein
MIALMIVEICLLSASIILDTVTLYEKYKNRRS